MVAESPLFSAAEEDFLRSCRVGRIGTHDSVDEYPHVVAVDYLFHQGSFFFGCGRESRKVRNLLADDRVAFEVDVDEPLPDGTLDWRGIMVKGRASLVGDEEEKAEVVRFILEKYPADTHDMGTTFVVVHPERKFLWGPWDRFRESR